MRQVRQVTKTVNPKGHARWTLERLYERLCDWAYEVYETRVHQTLGMTPGEAFATGVARMGERTHRRIPCDEDFLMSTLPTTRKGTAKVDSRHGVKINCLYYWSDAFRDPEVGGRQVPVRYDSFNMAVAYAFVRGRWVRCISEYYVRFEGRTEREVMLATAELRGQKLHQARSFTTTARKMADFLTSLEADEKLMPQRLRDAASKRIHQVIEGGQADQRATGIPALHTRSVDPTVEPAIGAPVAAQQSKRPGTLASYGDF